jgi:hypothetical protein
MCQRWTLGAAGACDHLTIENPLLRAAVITGSWHFRAMVPSRNWMHGEHHLCDPGSQHAQGGSTTVNPKVPANAGLRYLARLAD